MAKKHPGYEYKVVELAAEEGESKSALYKTAEVANRYAEDGWRTVGVIPPSEVQLVTYVRIHDGGLLLERAKQNPYNEETEWDAWVQWNVDHVEGY